MANRSPVLLFLKVPPPYGGGEVINKQLADRLRDDRRFYLFTFNSIKDTRVTQGEFTFRKPIEFVRILMNFIILMISKRPKIVYMRIGKDPITFLKDSVFFWIATIFGVGFSTELAGERFWILGVRSPILRWYARTILARVKSIRMLGKAIALQHSKEGFSNIVVMDNGVDIHSVENPMHKKNDIFTFLFIGAHTKLKGFHILIYAACELIDRGYDFKLVTMGNWESRDFQKEINIFIDKRSSQNWFHPLGLRTGQDKWQTYQSAHAVVLPSKTEGQPMSILEAFGFGLPVIATSVGGIPDIVNEGKNGLLIPYGNVSALAAAMEKLLSSKDLRIKMSLNNRAVYLKRFTLKRYVQNTKEWLINLTD